ncbi:hypothetical protein DITRI_Ditri09bG0043800 [Diplodiscus trichospermus]
MAFFTVSWFIWLVRNEKVFNNKNCDADGLVDLIKLRVTYWASASWPENVGNLMDIYRLPESFRICNKNTAYRGKVKWINPPFGCLKFNVDGASSRQTGLAGIEGVLGDHL